MGRRKKYQPTDTCLVEWCNSKPEKRGYCGKHRAQLRRHGEILEYTIYEKNKIISSGEFSEVLIRNKQQEVVAKAIIDTEDIPKVENIKWAYHARDNRARNARLRIEMSRLIMGAGPGTVVDHINGNSLDNRKSNLRICTQAENSLNKRYQGRGTSRFRGVYWSEKRAKWIVQVWLNKKRKYIGQFNSLKDAIASRRSAERFYYGQYAHRNGVCDD